MSTSSAVKFISVFLVVYQTIVFGSNREINREIKRGLDQAYSFNWEKAEEIFNNLIEKYPDDPRGYHYKSSIYLWYFLSSNDRNDLKTFESYTDTAVNKGELYLENNPEDEDIIYTLGATYTYRAIAFAKAESYLDAVWASKKSESFLSRVLELNAERYDAYLGLGLYNFAVGQIPSAFKWALNLAGISGEKKTGINYIKIAAGKGNLAKVEAEYYLAQLYTEVFFDYNSAAIYLRNLTGKYPENLVFNYSFSSLEIKRNNLDEADKILDEIVARKSNRFFQIISYSSFLKGDIFFKRNNFDSAKACYLSFLENSRDNDYNGIAYYRLALCYELTGDRDSAVKYFDFAGKGNMDLEDDLFAKRKGEIYYKRPLSGYEKELIIYSNVIESGKYKAAYDSLTNLILTIDEGLLSELYLHLSNAAYNLKLYEESLNYALKSLEFENDEKWIKPFASFYAAKAYRKLQNLSAAKNFIDEAEDYEDYDYQNKLKNMIDAFIDGLKV